jgi:hypothetical protein
MPHARCAIWQFFAQTPTLLFMKLNFLLFRCLGDLIKKANVFWLPQREQPSYGQIWPSVLRHLMLFYASVGCTETAIKSCHY